MIYIFFLKCVFLDDHGQTLMLDVKSQDIVENHGQSLHVIFGCTENNWVQGIQFQVARIESKKLDMILRYSTILAGVILFCHPLGRPQTRFRWCLVPCLAPRPLSSFDSWVSKGPLFWFLSSWCRMEFYQWSFQESTMEGRVFFFGGFHEITIFVVKFQNTIWLVVWNMAGLWLSIQLGMKCRHPNWRSEIFFRGGRYTTNQWWFVSHYISSTKNPVDFELSISILDTVIVLL